MPDLTAPDTDRGPHLVLWRLHDPERGVETDGWHSDVVYGAPSGRAALFATLQRHTIDEAELHEALAWPVADLAAYGEDDDRPATPVLHALLHDRPVRRAVLRWAMSHSQLADAAPDPDEQAMIVGLTVKVEPDTQEALDLLLLHINDGAIERGIVAHTETVKVHASVRLSDRAAAGADRSRYEAEHLADAAEVRRALQSDDAARGAGEPADEPQPWDDRQRQAWRDYLDHTADAIDALREGNTAAAAVWAQLADAATSALRQTVYGAMGEHQRRQGG